MQLTKEQIEIINSTGNIKINAVAGSGKTTTIIEYARTRPQNSRILYLAFNKSVKLEAISRFKEKGLTNVKVETAHSLAYRSIVYTNNYKVRHQGYNTHEIAEILGIQGSGEKHGEYVIANHINKFVSYFCNSNQAKIQDLNYLEIVSDSKAKSFVIDQYDYIESQTRQLLAKMDRGQIEITHDFYLKKFQLSNPNLGFAYILFDEGQDASPAMLDIFLKQRATKVIVGDTHQQIYGWRHAVNSLEKTDFKSYELSTSFRFSQDIANLGMEILALKSHIEDYKPITIIGQGKPEEIKTKATLARTNLGLLLNAIQAVTERKNVNHIYFEGNINSYTYADEGASLYDILNLYNGTKNRIRDKLIRKMNDLDELEEYIEKTEDVQLGLMIEIVKEYGNKIPSIIKRIKEKHIDHDDKEKAQMIFSTVHRCKGMEYDGVQIVDDFITEEKIKKLISDFGEEKIDQAKLIEEINLLYVAVTRTKNKVYIPEALMPMGFPKSVHIKVLKVKNEDENIARKALSLPNMALNESFPKSFSVEEVRKKHKRAYLPWTPDLDEELTVMFCEGVNLREIAKHFGRTKGAIRSRIKKLELEETYGE